MDEAEECFSEFVVVARTVMPCCLRGCSTSSACIGGRNRRSPIVGVQLGELTIKLAKDIVDDRRISRSGWLSGTRSSMST